MAAASALTLLVLADGTKPNFVVLFVDDMGIDQVGVDHTPYGGKLYGYSGHNGTIATPNVARLAAEGLLFQTWYSAFHVCSPSRAAMLTGRHDVRLGVGEPCGFAPQCHLQGGNQVFTASAVGGLPLNETTTAEALGKHGYTTAMVGKWHVGQREHFLPTNRGFQHYFGIPYSQDMGTSAWTPAHVSIYRPVPLPLLNGTSVVEQPVDLGTLTGRYAQAAVDFVASAPSPFYLYMSFNHIHDPNSAGPAFCGKSLYGAVGDATEETDWAIGEIMAAVRKRIAAEGDNTLVIFTSDNGGWLENDPKGNNPLRGGKTMVWEGGFREPAIAWGRGVKPGLTQAVAATIDVHTTLLSQAGVPLPQDRVMDGIDLTKVFAGESDVGHTCYPFYANPASHAPEAGLAAVRCGDFKAYWETTGVAPPAGHSGGKQDPPLMFNLVADPGENDPLVPDSAEYKGAMELIVKWRAAHLKSVTPVPSQNTLGSDEQYAICSKPGKLDKACTINPEHWQPKSVCENEACKQRQGLTKQCSSFEQVIV